MHSMNGDFAVMSLASVLQYLHKAQKPFPTEKYSVPALYLRFFFARMDVFIPAIICFLLFHVPLLL